MFLYEHDIYRASDRGNEVIPYYLPATHPPERRFPLGPAFLNQSAIGKFYRTKQTRSV